MTTFWPLLLSICIAATSFFATAQADDDSRYEIEVIVFERLDTVSSEVWPGKLSLQYPPQVMRLIDPNAEQAVTDETAVTDSEFESTPAADDSTVEATEPQSDTETAAEEPALFTQMPEQSRQLNAIATAISRQNNQRLLFHQRWLQPLQDRQQATALLMRAGESFDRHYELEGTIKLAVERYLHISTDLWLSRFAPRDNNDLSPWPLLPEAPKAINNVDEPMTSTAAAQSFWLFDNPLQAWVNNQYQVERTVVMRQSRRMRSGELHYLDHPWLGVIVRVDPYQPPSPDEES